MRMRLLPAIGVLALGVGGLAATGCDGVKDGQFPEDSGPPRIGKIMVQDIGRAAGRYIAVNLLNTHDPVKCDDTTPCDAPNICGMLFQPPVAEAFNDGFCHDPESVKEIDPPIGNPEPASLGGIGAAGAQIRVVFNKLLDPGIEKVLNQNCMLTGVPCATATAAADCPMVGDKCVDTGRVCGLGGTRCGGDDDCIAKPMDKCIDKGRKTLYVLQAGVVKLTTGGVEIDPKKVLYYYDPNGSPTVTSHDILDPYGPALVIKPKTPLHVKQTYTVVLDLDMIRSRDGNKLKDSGAMDHYDFTTEGLFVMQNWNCPSQNCVGAAGTINYPDTTDPTTPVPVSPGQFFQFQTNADTDDTTFGKFTLKNSAGTSIPIYADWDYGSDPALCDNTTGKTGCMGDSSKCHSCCDDNASPRMIDIVPVDATGKRASLAPGAYTLTITGAKDADTMKVTIKDLAVKITVGGTAVPDTDPFSANNVLLYSECMQPAPPVTDGGMDMSGAVDMSVTPTPDLRPDIQTDGTSPPDIQNDLKSLPDIQNDLMSPPDIQSDQLSLPDIQSDLAG